MIDLSYKVTLKQEQRLILWTLGDIGFGGARHDERGFNEDIEYLLREKERGAMIKVIIPGDMLAATSPSERASVIAAKGGKGLYSDTLDALDEFYQKRSDDFIKAMQPFVGSVWCVLSGHHLHNFTRASVWYGINNDEYISRALKADYAGTVAYIIVNINGFPYRILASHGYGSGRTHGGKLIKRLRVLEGFGADLVIMAHDDTRLAECIQIIDRRNDKICSTEARVIGIGAYEKSFRDGIKLGDYVEEALYSPVPIGATMVQFEIFKKRLRVRALI